MFDEILGVYATLRHKKVFCYPHIGLGEKIFRELLSDFIVQIIGKLLGCNKQDYLLGSAFRLKALGRKKLTVFDRIKLATEIHGILSKRSKNKRQNIKKQEKVTVVAGGANPEDPNDSDKNKWNKKNRDDKKESEDKYTYKNGRYEDTGYHHKNSRGNSKGGKSPAPKDGQRALDNSVKIKGNTPRRVAIENGYFVILDRTSPGVYHGHIETWSELRVGAQNALIEAGMVKPNGKIIKK